MCDTSPLCPPSRYAHQRRTSHRRRRTRPRPAMRRRLSRYERPRGLRRGRRRRRGTPEVSVGSVIGSRLSSAPGWLSDPDGLGEDVRPVLTGDPTRPQQQWFQPGGGGGVGGDHETRTKHDRAADSGALGPQGSQEPLLTEVGQSGKEQRTIRHEVVSSGDQPDISAAGDKLADERIESELADERIES